MNIKKLLSMFYLMVFATVTFAGDYQLRLPYDPGATATEDNGPVDNASCKTILSDGGSIGSGVYTINHEGVEQSVYCDMETAGGGWMLVLHWQDYQSGGLVTYKDLAINGHSMRTFTRDGVNYPVLATGTVNVFSEQLFKGGTLAWRDYFSDWFYYPIFQSTELPKASYTVTTASGSSMTMYSGNSGWGGQIEPNAWFGYWPTSGISYDSTVDCGGAGRAGGSNCPVAYGSNHPNHFDYSTHKFVFVR